MAVINARDKNGNDPDRVAIGSKPEALDMRAGRSSGVVLCVVAALSASAVVWYRSANPLPELAADLPANEADARREMDHRIKQRFPIGMSGEHLASELRQLGWGEVGSQEAIYGVMDPIGSVPAARSPVHNCWLVGKQRSINPFARERAGVSWCLDEKGRVKSIYGYYLTVEAGLAAL